MSWVWIWSGVRVGERCWEWGILALPGFSLLSLSLGSYLSAFGELRRESKTRPRMNNHGDPVKSPPLSPPRKRKIFCLDRWELGCKWRRRRRKEWKSILIRSTTILLLLRGKGFLWWWGEEEKSSFEREREGLPSSSSSSFVRRGPRGGLL